MANTKQTVAATLETATPTQATLLSLGSGSYYKVVGARVTAANTNATAGVQLLAVVSRAADPLSAGGLTASSAMARGDGLLLAESMAAGRELVIGELTGGDFVIDSDQLYSGDAGAYLGLRAVGLEADKVLTAEVELELETVSQSAATTGVYLSQLVKFQDA